MKTPHPSVIVSHLSAFAEIEPAPKALPMNALDANDDDAEARHVPAISWLTVEESEASA